MGYYLFTTYFILYMKIFKKKIKSKIMIQKQQKFFIELKKLIKTKPYIAIILAHEYFRNLYPTDPSIAFSISDPFKRINYVLNNLINIAKQFQKIGHYNINFEKKSNQQCEC